MEKEAETILAQNQKTMPTLTIFTPAYNRAHTLSRTYESLCRQTLQDFEWLVIDDGSTDSTRQLVERWIEEGKIQIRYIHQQNQGMHGAHNTAYDNIHTELNTCIDSDDYMPDDAVEKIVKFWDSQSEADKKKYAGFVGLDIDDKNNKIIGTPFPAEMRHTTLGGYYAHGGRGDKKLVYRTEVIKCYPKYPIFEGEKYVGLNYKYILIDGDYELLVLNEPLVIVDYQPDGSTSSMYRQYWNNPCGWCFYRKFQMRHISNLKRKFVVCTHYVSSSIICRNKKWLSESPAKLMTLLSSPFGLALYFIIKHHIKGK